MAYTIRRAYKAILATSSTTAFAFLSNGFSSLMPVSAFGYFAAVVVPVNYILIVFYFPAFIVIYETKFKYWELAIIKCLIRSIKCFYCRKCRKVLRKASKNEKNKKKGRRHSQQSDIIVKSKSKEADDKGSVTDGKVSKSNSKTDHISNGR